MGKTLFGWNASGCQPASGRAALAEPWVACLQPGLFFLVDGGVEPGVSG